jgi:N-formylglutamate amidohydrolase
LKFRKYFEIGLGTVPIVLSCPHGGFKKPGRIPDNENGVQLPDLNTYFIGKQIIHALEAKGNKIYYILNKIHRCKVDLNRPLRFSIAFNRTSKEAREIHQYYHKKLIELTQECLARFNRCLFIDFHGFTKPHKYYPDIIFGNIFGNTLTICSKPTDPDYKEYWGFTEVKRELSRHFSLDDGLGISDFNLPYSGGYITHQFYRKAQINAFQLEVAKYIRMSRGLTTKLINSLVSGIIKGLE